MVCVVTPFRYNIYTLAWRNLTNSIVFPPLLRPCRLDYDTKYLSDGGNGWNTHNIVVFLVTGCHFGLAQWPDFLLHEKFENDTKVADDDCYRFA